MEEGLRFNEGKLRYDLIQPDAEKGLVEILTFGSRKYAERNWEKGMKWSKVISSLKRHLAAIEAGEDRDIESGCLHADHLQCNAHFLSAYYRLYPQGDDRPHKYLVPKKIGLDLDGVLANFIAHLSELSGSNPKPTHWNDPSVVSAFNKIKKDPKFWQDLPVLTLPEDIPFEPHCYITARSIDQEVTQKWLDDNGFPKAKLYCVKDDQSKVATAKESGVDIFVDDKYENFIELNKAGILCYLFDQPWNQSYNVGHKRIKSLKELI